MSLRAKCLSLARSQSRIQSTARLFWDTGCSYGLLTCPDRMCYRARRESSILLEWARPSSALKS